MARMDTYTPEYVLTFANQMPLVINILLVSECDACHFQNQERPYQRAFRVTWNTKFADIQRSH